MPVYLRNVNAKCIYPCNIQDSEKGVCINACTLCLSPNTEHAQK